MLECVNLWLLTVPSRFYLPTVVYAVFTTFHLISAGLSTSLLQLHFRPISLLLWIIATDPPLVTSLLVLLLSYLLNAEVCLYHINIPTNSEVKAKCVIETPMLVSFKNLGWGLPQQSPWDKISHFDNESIHLWSLETICNIPRLWLPMGERVCNSFSFYHLLLLHGYSQWG